MQYPVIKHLDYPATKIEMCADNEVELKMRILGAVEKEKWTVEWIERIPDGGVYADVGANVGSYTLIAAARGLTTLAIEPGYMNYAKLCKNLALNNWLDRVLVFPFVLGNSNCITYMHYSDLRPGYASHVLGQPVPGDIPLYLHRQMVMAFRLDDLIRAFALPQPTHMKLDVDGSEELVLQGAVETLKGVQSIMTEMHEHQVESIPKLLSDAGFEEVKRYAVRSIYYSEWVKAAAEEAA